MSIFVMSISITPPRWLGVPVPGDAKFSLPGEARAKSMNSRTLLGGSPPKVTSV